MDSRSRSKAEWTPGSMPAIVVTLAMALPLFSTAVRTAQVAPQYRIIAYVRGRADIPRIGAEKLTHINYAFAVVSRDGAVVLKTIDSLPHLRRLQALNAKNPRLKVI